MSITLITLPRCRVPHICERRFSAKENLMRHEKRHNEGEQEVDVKCLQKCNLCNDFSTNRGRKLERHLTVEHDHRVRDFLCTNCGHSYIAQRHLDEHNDAVLLKLKNHPLRVGKPLEGGLPL